MFIYGVSASVGCLYLYYIFFFLFFFFFFVFFFFFFNDTSTTEIYTLSLHDALPILFHDAYQYFEKRFDIDVVGALTVNPEILPGAKQLTEIRHEIKHEKVKCLFSEPQFNPSIAKAIAKDTGVKIAVLDPLGAKLDASKDLYFQLIKNIALSFKNC